MSNPNKLLVVVDLIEGMTIYNAATLDVSQLERVDSIESLGVPAVLRLDMDGNLTIIGPDGVVIRTFSMEELEGSDLEIEKMYDQAFGPDFGRAVAEAFTATAGIVDEAIGDFDTLSPPSSVTLN